MEVSQIVVHEADDPEVVVGSLDANALAGEDGGEIDLSQFVADALAPTLVDGDWSNWMFLPGQCVKVEVASNG